MICPGIGEVPAGMDRYCVMSEESEVTYGRVVKTAPEA